MKYVTLRKKKIIRSDDLFNGQPFEREKKISSTVLDISHLCLFVFINSLFVLKYTLRTPYNHWVILVGYLFLMVVILFPFYAFVFKAKPNITKVLFFILVCLSLLFISYLQCIINPLSIKVDRWSAIHNFLNYLFAGAYPYKAQTHLGGYGSPFPVWQIFHIPFYLLGNVGLGFSFVFILAAIVFYYCYYKNSQNVVLFFLLLILSPAFWYEVVVRSDIFYNFLLCLVAIVYLRKKGYSIKDKPRLIGIICGLFLSTRISVAIPFFIFLFSDFLKSEIRQKTIFLTYVLGFFFLSLLPFLFWDFNSLLFFKYNPFVLQTRQGSLFDILIFAVVIILLSLFWKNNFIRCNQFISYALVFLVSEVFLHRMLATNSMCELFSNAYDISYFNMALPFIVYSISFRTLK